MLEKFPLLYSDCINIDSDKLLQDDQKVVTFVDTEKFEISLPKVRESVNMCAVAYKREVKKLLGIIFHRLAEGFSEQCGALFGFGPKADEDTKTLLKVSEVDGAKRQK